MPQGAIQMKTDDYRVEAILQDARCFMVPLLHRLAT